MFENIKAVFFDMDGTIVDSMWMWKKIDIEFLGKHNIELPDNLQREIEGMSFSETTVYFKERFSLKESLEEIKKIWNNMAIDKYKNEVRLKKGVMPVLELLRDKGYKTGIATSNSMELALACLEANGIKKYFDAIVTGCDVGAGKPAPDIYLKNAEICNVLPKESLVFEDVVQGIEAGHNAGMRVCAVFDEYSVYIDEEKHRKADYYINDFNEVIKELRKAEI